MSLKKFYCDECTIKHYQINDNISVCNDCSKSKSDITEHTFSLKHNHYNDSELEILDIVSNEYYFMRYRIHDLERETEFLKAIIGNLETKYKESEKKIEALQVAHESLLDTFRGYNK